MSVTDDSQDLSRTICIGVESPLSREEGGSPEVPLIRKRKTVGAAETSSHPKAARLGTSDPIFSNLSPLSQPKSSHPISVGELGNMEVGSSHVGDVARPSPSTVGVASTSGAEMNALQRDVRVASWRTAGSSGSVERNWVRKYNDRVDGAFSAAAPVQSKYLRGAGNVSITAVKTHVSQVGLGPVSGNLNKDLEDMNRDILAERRAKQSARRAGLVATPATATSTAAPPSSSVSKAPETSQAQTALALAQVCPRGLDRGNPALKNILRLMIGVIALS
ncbi:hypothetical protein COLO4_22750 [Corchorus olitorius]|uniref:Uncharacterized protein n=1 Tax=Corchorus olitorius TaxID=93759 RepID=A0A1R3IK57_9ROSI|nr:hypothetical protein COLO4_22750 [Corchorus olitorius]